MVNRELHCVQLFIRYIRFVTTLMLEKLPRAVVYCRAVRCLLRIVKYFSEVYDHGVRMVSITAVLRPHQFGLHI